MIEPQLLETVPKAPDPEGNNALPESRLFPTPSELVAMLDRKVIGHTQAKRDLAVAAYNHFLTCAHAEMEGGSVETAAHMILIGPTGSGKTHLLNALRDELKVPLVYLTCTGLTQNGYKGTNLNEVIESLETRRLDGERTQPAIVVWDEVDKLRELPTTHPVASRGVQQDMLTYLDGGFCGKSGMLDTSRFLNVACGAFVGLEKLRRQGKEQARIGFLRPSQDSAAEETMHPLTTDHLIEYGMIPEFIGRFGTVMELEPLNRQALRRILCEAEGSVLYHKRVLFEHHGIRLEFTDDALGEIVERAIAMQTGARGLKRVLETALDGVDHRLPDLAAQGVEAVVFNRAAVRGEAQPQEVTGSRKLPLEKLQALRQHAANYFEWQAKEKDILSELW